MDEVTTVNLNLTAAELVVLAEHLEVDPLFAVGERSDDEMDQMRSEGWRSLLARRFVVNEDEPVLISTDLSEFAMDVLAPLGLLTYTRVTGESARISHVFGGRHGLIAATPLAEDVSMYTTTDVDSVVTSILTDSRNTESDSVLRLETIDGLTQEPDGLLTWVQRSNGTILVDADEGPQVSDASDIQERVAQAVESFDKAGPTRD